MAKFKAGDDPADFTAPEVVEFLKGDEATPDEYDRVMEAERGNRGRVGILNLSGGATQSGDEADGELTTPAGEPAAGPNEAATGQESPADEAKTVSDPQASGDAGLTAEPYPDEAPASLGPEQPQTQAEAEAHALTIATQAAATQTPEEALAKAAELSKQWQTKR